MSTQLWYECIMEAGRGPSYWWPLVSEVLRDHSFHFGNPSLSGKMSGYIYNRYLPPYEGEKEETETRIGSFREVWDEVYREIGAVTLPFWWKDEDVDVEVMSFLGSSSSSE